MYLVSRFFSDKLSKFRYIGVETGVLSPDLGRILTDSIPFVVYWLIFEEIFLTTFIFILVSFSL